jgi:hypothetical protein
LAIFAAIRCASSRVSNFAGPSLKRSAKNRAYVRYDTDLLLVTGVTRREWLPSFIAVLTPAFAFKATPSINEARDHDAYKPVTCFACKLVHLVNPKTGKVFVAGASCGTARAQISALCL